VDLFAQNLIGGKNIWAWFIILLWILVWKGYALWTAAGAKHRGWFIALLIINTFGILEIFYIFFIAKKTWKDIQSLFYSPIKKKKEEPK